MEGIFIEFSEFRESDKSRGQFKDPLCYLCLADTVVTSLSLIQEVAGSTKPFNCKYLGKDLWKTQLTIVLF